LAKKELFLSLDQARDPTDEANVLFVYPLTEIGKRQTLKWWGFLGPVRQVKVGKSWKKSGNFAPFSMKNDPLMIKGPASLLCWRLDGELELPMKDNAVNGCARLFPCLDSRGGYVRKTNILGK
jgi:hypothetical protein